MHLLINSPYPDESPQAMQREPLKPRKEYTHISHLFSIIYKRLYVRMCASIEIIHHL